MRKSRLYVGIASLVVAALLFVFGEGSVALPIVFMGIGIILLARVRR